MLKIKLMTLKSKGMTQEQLALSLGVSSPAVSKWETDSSYPDISLLCPLARALGTNVDSLLHFEETLSEEQYLEHCNKIIEVARQDGLAPAEVMLQELMHQYPSSIALKYYAVTILTTFQMMFPPYSDEKQDIWKEEKKELLQQVHADGASTFWPHAVIQLAAIAISEGELEEAELLLKELPEHNADPTLTWLQLYLKREDPQKALEVIQKHLFVLVHQVQTCLMSMMSEQIEPDVEKALQICEIYRQFEELFGCGNGLSEGFFIELYIRAGQKQKALDSLTHYIDSITSPLQLLKPLLFSPTLNTKTKEMAMSREMREAFLQGLLTEESIADLRDTPDFQAAIEKLRSSL